MIRCDKCGHVIVGCLGRNINTEKLYCEICLDQMSKDVNTLAGAQRAIRLFATDFREAQIS